MGLISNGTTLLDAGALDSGIATGGMKLLSTLTASSSATLDFTSGLTSTYDQYIFKFINIHPASESLFSFQVDTGTNTSYNQDITSTLFRAYHAEADNEVLFGYRTANDQAQGTGFQNLAYYNGVDNDSGCGGKLTIFSPASTALTKHFISRVTSMRGSSTAAVDNFAAGYINTTTAITRVRFKMDSGNIDSGTIKMYGVYSG